MKKSRKFNNILDECLERLLVKGETIEQCLQSYPEQAEELEPLLQTALATKKKASAIQPHPEFRVKARYQFRSALQAVEPKRRVPFFSWQPRWVTTVIIVLVLLLAGGSTVASAGNSMPDSPLYPVKLATEQVRLTLTPPALGKAELYTKLADKRVAEIIYIASKGKPERVEQISQRLNNSLLRIASLPLAQKGGRRAAMAPAPGKGAYVQTDSRARLRMTLGRYAINHPARLRAALETAPESVKPALLRAIAVSETSYENALKSLD